MKKYIALCLVLMLSASCYLGVSAQAITPISQESVGYRDLANDEIDFDDLQGIAKPTGMRFPPISISEGTEGSWAEDEGGRYYHYDLQDFIQYQVTFSDGHSQIFKGSKFVYQDRTYSLTITDTQSSQSPWTVGNTYQVAVSLGNMAGTVKITITERKYVPGDCDGNGTVNNEDVIYLLWHTMFAESYPLAVSGDCNEDGAVNNEDVIYLLWHTMFPESYPLK